jgi:hypothetical protein
MRPKAHRHGVLGLCGLAMAGLWGCATPAVVFVSPDYATQHIQRVAVMGFSDAPARQGSGALVADVFEKYLFNLHYDIVDPSQSQSADAVVTGSVSELTDTSEQTVMVNVPQEETVPVYQDVAIPTRHGGVRVVTEQTGTQTNFYDQSVPETETLPARVGFSARLVSSKNGKLLWSGSGSADGMDIPSAAEAAASKVINALQKALASTPSPVH